MRIEAPKHFRHASEFRYGEASEDPRDYVFPADSFEVDLRGCEFVRPPAALWCAVYPLLARLRTKECRLLVPENMGLCVYLQSLGLFAALQANGIEVDDRGVGKRVDSNIVLPMTSFQSEFEVEGIANEALERLSASKLGAPNLHPLVSEVFAELALNAVEHSESPIAAYGLIQFYRFEQGERFVCAVADGGIGIRKSLERNPEVKDRVPYDWTAIELAVRERVSGTGSKTRGIGLFGVAEDMRKPRRSLLIHSGLGSMEINEELESDARRAPLFPGTLAYASIPT